MTLTKIENGVEKPLTADEVAEVEAREAEVAANYATELAKVSLRSLDIMLTRREEELVNIMLQIDPTTGFHPSVEVIMKEKQTFRDFLRDGGTLEQVESMIETYRTQREAGDRPSRVYLSL